MHPLGTRDFSVRLISVLRAERQPHERDAEEGCKQLLTAIRRTRCQNPADLDAVFMRKIWSAFKFHLKVWNAIALSGSVCITRNISEQ